MQDPKILSDLECLNEMAQNLNQLNYNKTKQHNIANLHRTDGFSHFTLTR